MKMLGSKDISMLILSNRTECMKDEGNVNIKAQSYLSLFFTR